MYDISYTDFAISLDVNEENHVWYQLMSDFSASKQHLNMFSDTDEGAHKTTEW